MRIVQSFWSKNESLLGSGFGWLKPEFHIMAWALSCLKLNEYYDDLHLYTDTSGSRILCEYLELPYKTVNIHYNHLGSHFNKNLWAIPKILTYAEQDKPFIHVDGDVFIWKKFPDELENADLICQNFERGTEYYGEQVSTELPKLRNIPTFLKGELERESIPSINAGILGGNNIDFIKRYADDSLNFVHANHKSGADDHPLFNIIFEQMLFLAKACNEDVEIKTYFDKTFNDNGYFEDEIGDFLAAPHTLTYIHTIGSMKKNRDICKSLAKTLLREYPPYFFKIVALFQKQHIFYKTKISKLDRSTIKRPTSYNEKIRSENQDFPFTTNFRHSERIERLKAAAQSQRLMRMQYSEIEKYEEFISNKLKYFYEADLEIIYNHERQCVDPQAFYLLAKCKEKCFTLKSTGLAYVYNRSFRWSTKMKELIMTGSDNPPLAKNEGIAIVASLFDDGYTELVIDELDYNIFAILQKESSFTDLFNTISECFGLSHDKIDEKEAVRKLIIYRLKSLLFNGCIKILSTGKEL